MATRSSITGEDRNPGLTESEIEAYLNTYLGVEQIIWLDGQYGGNEDITDQHIDGFVKFVGDHTLVTMNNADLAYWYVSLRPRHHRPSFQRRWNSLHPCEFAADSKSRTNHLGPKHWFPKFLCQLLRRQLGGARS